MAVKSRFTAVFQDAEHVGESSDISDDQIIVKGGPNVVTQERWVWDSRIQEHGGPMRITWKIGDYERSNLSRLVGAALSPGLNVYSLSDEPLRRSLETPFYKSFHSAIFDIEEYFPPGSQDLFRFLRPDKCDVDIKITANRIEVAQWCLLPSNETLTFRKEEGIDACEVGLFYLDTRDHIDVNLSGLRCKWGPNDKVDNCQKTTLFYKTSHIESGPLKHPVVKLETPVGLHPKMLVDLRNFPTSEKCEYFTYLQLPVDLFIDRFQSSPVFLYGEHDLELPEYKLRDKSWGSEALFRLDAGIVNEVPLHSRYVEPVKGNESKIVTFTPLTFQACDSNDSDITQNPFYSRGPGYESFFTSDTIFSVLDSTNLEVAIPKPDVTNYEATKLVTLACLLLSLVYIWTKVIVRPRSERNATR